MKRAHQEVFCPLLIWLTFAHVFFLLFWIFFWHSCIKLSPSHIHKLMMLICSDYKWTSWNDDEICVACWINFPYFIAANDPPPSPPTHLSLHIHVIIAEKRNYFLSLTHITVDNEQQIVSLNCKIAARPRILFILYFYFIRVSKLNFSSRAMFVHHQLANVVYSWKLRNKLSSSSFSLNIKMEISPPTLVIERMKSIKFYFYINHGCLLAFWSCKNIWKDSFN